MVLLVVVVAIGLAFDFTNGFHDTANYVATWVGTRALSPRPAVLISAVANLAGAFVTTAVAKTVGKGLIDTSLATEQTVLAALFGAIAWNLLTWRPACRRARRMPSSAGSSAPRSSSPARRESSGRGSGTRSSSRAPPRR